jgi:5-methylcytosine-specific restriction endonuclease McrA
MPPSRAADEGERRLPDGGQHFPALVLNADFRPLSYFPLSVWAWQDAVKAVFLDRVSVLSEYEREVHSPSLSMRLPSVIALKDYIPSARRPAFTRFNVFLRDAFVCQYCGGRYPAPDLTFDHVVPRSRGGRTTWENVVTACGECNLRKGSRLPRECSMFPRSHPRQPTTWELMAAPSRPIICTRVGATSSTGIASWRTDPAKTRGRRPVPSRAGWYRG